MFHWFDYFRVCLLCKTYQPPTDILCSKCWADLDQLAQSKNSLVSSNYSFSLKRLWVWNELSGDYVGPMIYNLKQGHSPLVYQRLARAFLCQIPWHVYCQKRIVFIAAPATNSRQNHALFLAKALSQITNFPCFDPLEIVANTGSQKRLRLHERSKRKMRLKEAFTMGSEKHFIFVDDVVTTGSTIRAAYRALLKPLHFEAWVLAEKTKSIEGLLD